MVVRAVEEVTTSGVNVVDASGTAVVNIKEVEVGSARVSDVEATVDDATGATLGTGVPVLDVSMTIVDVADIAVDTGAAITTELVVAITTVTELVAANVDTTEEVSIAGRVTVEVRISDVFGVGTTVVVATAGGVVVGKGTANEFFNCVKLFQDLPILA